MSSELPEPWGSLLEPKGIHSYRDLGAAASVGHETARRLVRGGRTSPSTVNKVAEALFGGDRDRVWRLHGAALEDHGEWELPPEASLLNEEQRAAVLAVVRAMLPAEAKREDGELGGNTAPNTPPGSGPDLQLVDPPAGEYDEDLDQLPDERDEPPPIGGRSLPKAARKETEQPENR